MNLDLKLLRLPQVVERTSLSKSSIYRKEKNGQFPKRLSLGGNCVAWRSIDVDRWMNTLAFVGARK